MTAPVRLIQTVAFPGTYTPGGTWTATSTGTLSATIFDGVTPAVGDSFEINSLGVAALGNGIFQRVVDVASKFTCVRRADANSNPAFLNGVGYDVLDGTTLKGSRRQLCTQGTVTLDSTALKFDAVRERDLLKIDVTKTPYFVKSYLNGTTSNVHGAAGENYAPAIQQALYDCHLAGGGKVVLPHG